MDAALLGSFFTPFSLSSNPLSARLASINTNNDTPASPGDNADQADLARAAAAPNQVLNAEILRSLDAALARDGVGLDRNATPADFSPEKVAERVLGFIDSVVNQAAGDDTRRSTLLRQARDGVEQGFQEARDILDGLGVLQGDIADNVDKTYALIQDGLDRLAAGESALSAAAQDGGPLTQLAFQSSSISASRSTSLVVDTLDGDRVTISIDKQVAASRTRFAASDGTSQLSGIETKREASSNFSFSVDGELDDKERQAIESLVKRIDKVSDKFFDGNVQAAFNKAAKLKFNSKELAGFSLDLKFTRSIEAVRTYSASASDQKATGGLADIAGFGQDLRGLFSAAEQSTLARPAEDAARLFKHLVDERAAHHAPHSQRDGALSSLRGLLDQLLAERETPAEDAGHEHERESVETA